MGAGDNSFQLTFKTKIKNKCNYLGARKKKNELPVRISNSSICAASPETSMRYVNLW